MQRRSQARICVCIVSTNSETLDGLQSYLGDAGVASRCARDVADVSVVVPDGATAAVIFPDDFEGDATVALVHHLRRVRPRFLSVLVTREPQRYGNVLRPDGRSTVPVVLAKPSFGWEILDAIRSSAAGDQA